jgi:hypothetical protein
VRQAQQALRIHFANFLNRTEWRRRARSAVADGHNGTDPPAAPHERRARLGTRRDSVRTETHCADWLAPGVSDSELDAGAVGRSKLQLSKQAVAVPGTE